jgi:hypothetical protein
VPTECLLHEHSFAVAVVDGVGTSRVEDGLHGGDVVCHQAGVGTEPVPDGSQLWHLLRRGGQDVDV